MYAAHTIAPKGIEQRRSDAHSMGDLVLRHVGGLNAKAIALVVTGNLIGVMAQSKRDSYRPGIRFEISIPESTKPWYKGRQLAVQKYLQYFSRSTAESLSTAPIDPISH